MKKIICLICLLLVCAMTGCSTFSAPDQGSAPFQSEGDTSTLSTAAFSTEPIFPGDTEPTEKPEELDRFESGKPYIPSGNRLILDLKLDNGHAIQAKPRMPELRQNKYVNESLWIGSTQDKSTSFMFSLKSAEGVDADLKNFFQNNSDAIVEDICKADRLKKETRLKLMAPQMVEFNGVSMCQVRGAITYFNGLMEVSHGFLAHAMITEQGDVLYWLVQCDYRDWSGCQEISEIICRTILGKD